MAPRRLPRSMRPLFWNIELEGLDVDRDADAIIATVVEFGLHSHVRWLLRVYGEERIHRFFRETGSPEISDRTVAFWRAYFHAEREPWPRPAAWRRSSSAPWVE